RTPPLPHQPGPITARPQLRVADGAQQLLGLGRAQTALSPARVSGTPARWSAPPAARRRLVLAAPAVPDGELEVPLRGTVVRPQQQGLAVGALGVGQMPVTTRAVVIGLTQ